MADKLTDEKVRHVAKLSRLKLTDQQVHHFAASLSHVLDYVDKLSAVDVAGVEPMAHPTDMVNRLRDDAPIEPIAVETALQNAPDAEPPFFKVPKVLTEGSGA